nr:Der1like family putative [Albugo laibachii Nc14]|eukprot:CCA13929.1 Der1like family putative [Albugo laibachii Nc14]
MLDNERHHLTSPFTPGNHSSLSLCYAHKNIFSSAKMNDPLEWYYDIPIISRLYLTGCFLTTASCALDLISPFSLYYNFNLIFYKGQVWRLVSNFLFFGLFSLDFLFHMYFVVRYCRLLEEGSFRNRPADYVYMLLFGAALMILVAPFVSVHFLGSSLTFMMVYIWGRRNSDVRMSFLGLFPFTAPYLPWVLLSFSIALGNSATTDLIGIFVGHTYYFLEDIYPSIAAIRGWKIKRPLTTPRILKYLCDPQAVTPQYNAVPNVIGLGGNHLHNE